MEPLETKYKGCRFRSRLEARWAVFFDTLEIKWWYEPEGFPLTFDYEQFAVEWEDATGEDLLEEGLSHPLESLGGKEYWYAPDFYLPEMNYWIEIKGPAPTKAEQEKAFLLSVMLYEVTIAKTREASPFEDKERAWDELMTNAVYIVHADIPYPAPKEGHILGYGKGAVGQVRSAKEYFASHGLCWQQCVMCKKIGIGVMNAPYCENCYENVIGMVWKGLRDQGIETDLTINSTNLVNRSVFTSGHETPDLQKAYAAARSARFF